MDFYTNSTDVDWGRLATSTGAGRPPCPGPTQGELDPVYPELSGEASPRSQQKSHIGEEENTKEHICTFNCFRRLSNHLGNLNTMERQPNIICLEVTLSNADIVMGCAQSVLECYFCRLDSKALLLLMTVLQTVLNWLRVEYTSSQQRQPLQNIPAIFFGRWKVPEADGHLIKGLLIRRILTTCGSVVKVLRLRLDEIVLVASRGNLTYQLMDAESLQHTLQRLTSSLKQLMELVKALSQERDPQNTDS